jgi:glycosyltransferase involved in cell wall biosynthesis
MKIAFLLPRLDDKSSITLFQDLIPQLEFIDTSLKIDIYYFDKNISLDFNNTTRIEFFNFFPVNNYDIVHSSGFRPNFYIFLHKKSFNLKTKFITTIHSFIYDDFKNQFNILIAIIFSKIWYYVLKYQDIVVVLTETSKLFYSHKISSEIEVINNGRRLISSNFISGSDRELMSKIKQKFKFVMGTHAVVSKIKGLDIVIRSLKYLNEFCFVVIGEGPEIMNLKSLAKKLNVYHQVFFLGFKKNIGSFFQFYDVYVMPSRSEGLPIALIEAVSFKTPCLTSDISTFKELFTNNEVAFFKLDDVNDFCNQVIKFKNKSYGESLIDNAYLKFVSKYSDEVMARNYYNLYRKLL